MSQPLNTLHDFSRRPSQNFERWLLAFGVLDQAVRGWHHARRGSLRAMPPRSLALTIFQVYSQFGLHPGLLSKTRVLGQAASCAAQLTRDWGAALNTRTERLRLQPRRRLPRAYTVASLAAATFMIPWLLFSANRKLTK